MKSIQKFVLFILLPLLGSCADRGSPVDPQSAERSFGQMTITFGATPSEIATVVARLSRSGYPDRTLTLSISDSSASGVLSEVPVGNWHLLVEASDQNGIVRYRGETNVSVQPGATTIVTLQLSAVSGELEIHVTWGSSQPGSLIVNGGFELGPGGAWNYYFLDSGSTAMPGWVVTRGQIDIHRYWQNAEGDRSLDLDGSPGRGGVKQTFSTVPGASYRVRFAISGNPEGPPTIKRMDVTAAGQSTQYDIDVTGKTIQNMGWQTVTWTFSAVDSVTTLEFFSLDSAIGWYGPALDNVIVQRVP